MSCAGCGSRYTLPELTWEPGEDPYISQVECLRCGHVRICGKVVRVAKPAGCKPAALRGYVGSSPTLPTKKKTPRPTKAGRGGDSNKV